jgi:hypothetical protein
VGGLSGQGVELFSHSEAFCPFRDYPLLFLEHVHEFNASQRALHRSEGLEPHHGTGDPLDRSVILLHDIVQIFW